MTAKVKTTISRGMRRRTFTTIGTIGTAERKAKRVVLNSSAFILNVSKSMGKSRFGSTAAGKHISRTFPTAMASFIVFLLIGILFVGIGYVLVMQTTTAWVKNLYPENSRGQFEGVRIVFNVLIPMILGPGMANIVISNWGIPVVIDGSAGMAPSGTLFFAAAAVMVLVLLPTYMAVKTRKQ